MMDDLKKDFGGDVCSDGMETDEDEAAECFCDLQRQWIGSSGHAIYHGVRRATKRRMDGRSGVYNQLSLMAGRRWTVDGHIDEADEMTTEGGSSSGAAWRQQCGQLGDGGKGAGAQRSGFARTTFYLVYCCERAHTLLSGDDFLMRHV